MVLSSFLINETSVILYCIMLCMFLTICIIFFFSKLHYYMNSTVSSFISTNLIILLGNSFIVIMLCAGANIICKQTAIFYITIFIHNIYIFITHNFAAQYFFAKWSIYCIALEVYITVFRMFNVDRVCFAHDPEILCLWTSHTKCEKYVEKKYTSSAKYNYIHRIIEDHNVWHNL